MARIFTLLILALIFAGGIFSFACYSFGIPSLYRVASNPGRVKGRVAEKQAQNRNHVRYVYEVNGAKYEGSGGVGPRFDNIKLGDEVEVEYDPQDPAFSLTAIGSKRELFEDTVIISAIFSLLAGFFVALGTLGFRMRLLARR
jgi:hypothetical protein